MATMNWKGGVTRICMVTSVIWILGMGWYQYQGQKNDDSSMTISISKDAQLRIDASGIKQEDKSTQQVKKLLWVFLPPFGLLLLIPVGDWLARGFRPEGQ